MWRLVIGDTEPPSPASKALTLAQINLRRAENTAGDFFVDSSCIDCDTCRWMAPDIFSQAGAMSAVTRQPQNEAERLLAGQALLSCPTNSIGCQPQDKALMNATLASFPIPIAGPVSYLGFASPNSFGAASYYIQRPQGNVIIDSPRMNGALGKRLDSLGGARWMLLTHRDDVADHNEWSDRFGCARVLHLDEIDARTRDVEVKPEGEAAHKIDDDLLYIPVPGHTKGHSVILYDNKYLFTGDHLEYDEDAKALRAFKDYCWYDWGTQIESMKKLSAYDFEWVLPGHGRRFHAPKDKMKEMLKECLEWMGK